MLRMLMFIHLILNSQPSAWSFIQLNIPLTTPLAISVESPFESLVIFNLWLLKTKNIAVAKQLVHSG